MNKEINYNYKLPPFKWFCLTNFPFIEADFDALTYYELLCKVVQYLNEVIVKTNAIGEQTEELTNAFNTLKEYVDTYFENLDVQEEINNKLDKMAEDGTLQEIISEYLNSTALFGFDNVNDMISATNLINGSYAKTMGYFTKNDGGQGLYKIRTITNDDVVDNGSIIAMSDDTLVAELITNDTINVKQFGAKGDGITNDTTSIQNAINFAENNHKKLLFSNDTYVVTNLLIDKYINIDGLNCTIKSKNNNDSDYIVKLYYNGAINTIFKNVVIDGNRTNNASDINGLVIQMYNYADTRLLIENVKVNYCSNYGVYVTGNWSNTSVREMTIKNLICYKNKIGMYVDSCSDSYLIEGAFDHNDYYGLYLDNAATFKITNVKAYWNGSLLNEDINPNRLPDSAISVTSDETPQSGKKYYTRSGIGTFDSPYNYTLFSGESFVSGTTYYEINGDYKNHGNGFYFKQCTGIYMTNCESQDNAGDGIYVDHGNLLMIENTGLDSNGLIFDTENAVYSYTSKNLNPYFYGIYLDGTIFAQIKGYMNNYRYNQLNYVQKSGIYADSVQNFNFNISSRLQQNQIDYKNIDIRNFDGIINGKSLKINLPLSYITFNDNDYSLNNNQWAGSNLIACDGILYFKLVIDNNADKIPTTENTQIGTLHARVRPKLTYTTIGTLSESYMDQQTDIGLLSIDPNGAIRIKGNKANCRALSITGSFIFKD